MTYERAAAMMSYVGSYYGRSRIYKAQNQTKGTEFDLLRSMIDEIADQFFVETATWGIERWEQYCGLQSNDGDRIEVRRQRVISWLQIISPITPKVMRRLCEGAVNAPVEVMENVAPYTFGVYFDFPSTSKINILDLLNVIEEAKPAHLALFLQIRLFAADCNIIGAACLSSVSNTMIMPQYLRKIDRDIIFAAGAVVSGVLQVAVEPITLKQIENAVSTTNICVASTVISTVLNPHKFEEINLDYCDCRAAYSANIMSTTVDPLYDTGAIVSGGVLFAGALSTVNAVTINAKEG